MIECGCQVDAEWAQSEFITTVQKRGAAVIAARGASSAMSAAKATADQKLPRRSVRGGLQKRIIMNCKNPGRRNMAAQPGGASTWGTDGRDLLGGEASINRPLSVSSIGQRRQGTYIFATGLPAAGVWGSGANPSRARGRSSA